LNQKYLYKFAIIVMKKVELDPDELTAIFVLKNLTKLKCQKFVDGKKIINSRQEISKHDDNKSTESEISIKEISLEENNHYSEFYIEDTIKKIRSLCSDTIIKALDPHLDDCRRE